MARPTLVIVQTRQPRTLNGSETMGNNSLFPHYLATHLEVLTTSIQARVKLYFEKCFFFPPPGERRERCSVCVDKHDVCVDRDSSG